MSDGGRIDPGADLRAFHQEQQHRDALAAEQGDRNRTAERGHYDRPGLPARAAQLQRDGATLPQIAAALGVTESAVEGLLNDACDAYVPPGSGTVRCCASDANFICNAAHGHPGDHVAYGVGGVGPCHSWPQSHYEAFRRGGGLHGDTGASSPGTVTSYLACGDKVRAPAAIRPGTPVTCSLHGDTLLSTTVISPAQWLAEHPALVSDVGALSPGEAAAVAFVRHELPDLGDMYLTAVTVRSLLAIIDRLTGVTEGGK